MKSIVFIFIFTLSKSAIAEIADSSVMSLDIKRAIEFAVERSPVFDTLKRQLSITELEKLSAKARLLPSLDLTTTHGIQDASPRAAGPWGSEINLGLTESLYNNGVSQTNYRIAILNLHQAEYKFQDQQNKTCLDISSQFLIYSLNVKLQEIQENQFKLVSKQYDLISKAYFQGIKTQNDFLRFKAQVSRSEIDMVNSKNAVEKSKQELLRLIGIDIRSKQKINFIPIPLEMIKSEITESTISIEDHLQFKSAQIQKDINQLNSDLIGRNILPEWYLSTGISYDNSRYISSGQKFSDNAQVAWNALLTVKYNFFDWGIRSSEKEIAAQKNIIQNNDLDTDLLRLKSSLVQLDITVNQVQRNYKLAKELLTLEKTNLDFVEREYRNGKIQYLDLINGLNNLSDAQIKYYTATYDLQTTRYTLLYHQGKLYEELLK